MVFVPGKSGNPSGRSLDKPVTDALRKAALSKDRQGKIKLYRMCEAIMSKAAKGQPWACEFVADRLEGKPMATVDHSLAGGGFLEILDMIAQSARDRGPLVKLIEHDKPTPATANLES